MNPNVIAGSVLTAPGEWAELGGRWVRNDAARPAVIWLLASGRITGAHDVPVTVADRPPNRPEQLNLFAALEAVAA